MCTKITLRPCDDLHRAPLRWPGRLAVVILALGVLAGRAPNAVAQPQTKDQQKCTNAMNLDLQKVGAAAAGNLTTCLKDGSKGRLGPLPTVEACATADAKDKVAKAVAKTIDDFTKSCTGTSSTGAPKAPPWGVTDAATVNAAGAAAPDGLLHDLLGADLDTATVLESTDVALARCQQLLVKDVRACQATHLREFAKCKKNGLKSSADPPRRSRSRPRRRARRR